ncbi:hypothetical protein BRADI_1g32463v3 [Brachypodium distachyon]|uniref:Uncharacterized protein n=1 Tax=Brachypodium distachyon TaxID=15368 RepID=A0A0Q3H2G4_BRADI|nr:hypothetical protein BRADI_1g32463v3 [Brachypodium distachyon]
MTLTRGCGWRRGRARRTWGWSAWWRASACRTACYCGLNEQASTADSSAAAASTTVGLYELGGHNDFTPAGTTISPDFTLINGVSPCCANIFHPIELNEVASANRCWARFVSIFCTVK